MKRVAAALGAAVWLCLVLPAPALAALLRDDCGGESLSWASYSNLSPSAYWSGLEDPTSLALSRPGSLGQAVYRLSGAQSVEITLHTRLGAFATLEGEQWMLTSSLTGLSPEDCRAVEFCPMDNSLYVSNGAISLRAQVSPQSGAILFVPSNHGHPHTQRYGLTLSADAGRGFVPCQAALVSVEAIQNKGMVRGYIETYRAGLPAGTVAVRVSLRDFTHYYSADGSLIAARASQASLWLARAVFTGSRLSTGSGPGGESSSGLPPPDGGVPSPGEPGRSYSEQFFTPPDQVPRPGQEEPQPPKEAAPEQPGAPPPDQGQAAQPGKEPPAQEGEGSSGGGEAARPPRETGLLPPPSRDLAGWATLLYVGAALVGITIILRKMK